MVVRILKERGSMDGPLNYNFDKVNEKVATIIATKNLEQPDEAGIRERFAWLENGNFRSNNVSFHMSINPNIAAGEKLSNEDARNFTEEIMKELGMDGQPYVIFRHNDIEREHFHVVSIRIKEDGRQISNYHDRTCLKSLLIRLQRKYNYTLGNGEKKEKKQSLFLLKKVGGKPIRFNQTRGNVMEQFQEAFETGIKYKFESFPQFAAVMADYGFRVEMRHVNGMDIIAFQGLNERGLPVTRYISDTTCSEYYERFVESQRTSSPVQDTMKTREHERQKASLKHQCRACLNISESADHFVNIMRKKGVGVHVQNNVDGRIIGAIYVDHNNMTVYKGSDLSKDFSANALQYRINSGIWSEQIKIKPSLSDVHGIGIHPVPQDQKPEQTVIESSPSYQAEPSIAEELMLALAAHTSPSKGKDLQKKKKKVKKARYL